ncbi:hypothetical protein CXB51_026290 [Gossypium anomalum]|uniref:Uncharacterized protein n=1 Tax=Gossypium anomalum TaxID=47600 RepID=A0A8J5Z4V5_9ROSI|nr:hypothetical protein CXB51_026290 [Gossypium anomalum]
MALRRFWRFQSPEEMFKPVKPPISGPNLCLPIGLTSFASSFTLLDPLLSLSNNWATLFTNPSRTAQLRHQKEYRSIATRIQPKPNPPGPTANPLSLMGQDDCTQLQQHMPNQTSENHCNRVSTRRSKRQSEENRGNMKIRCFREEEEDAIGAWKRGEKEEKEK